MKRIFVSIASYRDPDLDKTINSCLSQATGRYPIDIGVAWQKDENEVFVNKDKVSFLEIPYQESLGACWARSRIQKELYNGQAYYLQLDSHHRFVPKWDLICVKMLENLGERSLLSSYVPDFNPDDEEASIRKHKNPWGMTADKFCVDSHVLLFRPTSFSSDVPQLNRFISGHFLFSTADFVEKVPYDPELYFSGEEITLALRAYTFGYNVYCPMRNVVFHEYTRKNRVKHWQDHTGKSLSVSWLDLDRHSKQLCDNLLIGSEEEAIKSGLFGTERTRRQYEEFAGVKFKEKMIHPDAKNFPISPIQNFENWLEDTSLYKVRFDLSKKEVWQEDDIKFCFIGVENKDNSLIYRKDLSDVIFPQNLISLSLEFETFTHPSHIVIWPYSENKGWLKKIEKKAKFEKVS